MINPNMKINLHNCSTSCTESSRYECKYIPFFGRNESTYAHFDPILFCNVPTYSSYDPPLTNFRGSERLCALFKEPRFPR